MSSRSRPSIFAKKPAYHWSFALFICFEWSLIYIAQQQIFIMSNLPVYFDIISLGIYFKGIVKLNKLEKNIPSYMHYSDWLAFACLLFSFCAICIDFAHMIYFILEMHCFCMKFWTSKLLGHLSQWISSSISTDKTKKLLCMGLKRVKWKAERSATVTHF